jgi:hypothetical protein
MLYPPEALERAMKIQDVILRGLSGLLRRGAEAERSHPDHEFARRARGNSAGCRTLPRHVMAGLFGTTPVRRCSASACPDDSLLSSGEGGSPPMTVMAKDTLGHKVLLPAPSEATVSYQLFWALWPQGGRHR